MKRNAGITLITIAIILMSGFIISRGYVYYYMHRVDKMVESFFHYADQLPETRVINEVPVDSWRLL